MPAKGLTAQRIVFVRATCAVSDSNSGAIVALVLGDVWAKDDPLVRERPDLFSDAPTFMHRTIPVAQEEWRIETATRAPGRRRGRHG